MMNLFSIFDPTSKFFNSNWLAMLMPLFLFQTYWILMYPLQKLFYMMKLFLSKELKLLLSKSSMSLLILAFSIMFMISSINMMSLIPFIFTPTSHIMITLSLALPLWMTSLFYGWIHHNQQMFCHLVPMGTPTSLMPMMVMIETISSLIRPITLSVRLAANMVAGHLLIALISLQNDFTMNILCYMGQFLLDVLELAVAMIQAYVFMILITLYMNEIK